MHGGYNKKEFQPIPIYPFTKDLLHGKA